MPLLPIDQIRMDGDTQVRADTNQAKVDEYAELMREGVEFRAVTVFFDGSDHWLGGGVHRVLAAIAAGRTHIEADVRSGKQRDAILFSLEDNKHGLPLSTADKRKAVAILLSDPEWSAWSDREIARHLGVGNSLVSKIRRESFPGTVVRKGADGRTINTAKIGSGAEEPLSQSDQAMLAECERKIDEGTQRIINMGMRAIKIRDLLSPVDFEHFLHSTYDPREVAMIRASIRAIDQFPGHPYAALAMVADAVHEECVVGFPTGRLDPTCTYATFSENCISASVYPSDQPGFWFVTVYDLGDGSSVAYSQKPVREDAIAKVLSRAGYHRQAGVEWNASPCEPAASNPDMSALAMMIDLGDLPASN
jgi:hypothetical protein